MYEWKHTKLANKSIVLRSLNLDYKLKHQITIMKYPLKIIKELSNWHHMAHGIELAVHLIQDSQSWQTPHWPLLWLSLKLHDPTFLHTLILSSCVLSISLIFSPPAMAMFCSLSSMLYAPRPDGLIWVACCEDCKIWIFHSMACMCERGRARTYTGMFCAPVCGLGKQTQVIASYITNDML